MAAVLSMTVAMTGGATAGLTTTSTGSLVISEVTEPSAVAVPTSVETPPRTL